MKRIPHVTFPCILKQFYRRCEYYLFNQITLIVFTSLLGLIGTLTINSKGQNKHRPNTK